MQQLQQQLQEAQAALRQEQERAQRELSEAQQALSSEQARGEQQDRQLAQMVEAQRRLGLELQEGEEAREQAQASRTQAQVCAILVVLHLVYNVDTLQPSMPSLPVLKALGSTLCGRTGWAALRCALYCAMLCWAMLHNFRLLCAFMIITLHILLSLELCNTVCWDVLVKKVVLLFSGKQLQPALVPMQGRLELESLT